MHAELKEIIVPIVDIFAEVERLKLNLENLLIEDLQAERLLGRGTLTFD